MPSNKSLLAIAIVGSLAGSCEAFTAPSSKVAFSSKVNPALFMSEEEEVTPLVSGTERGVSIDQDGKSNVWAIEPKVEVESKSNEEKTGSAILAAGGFAAFAAAAAVILTNLPDPDQF